VSKVLATGLTDFDDVSSDSESLVELLDEQQPLWQQQQQQQQQTSVYGLHTDSMGARWQQAQAGSGGVQGRGVGQAGLQQGSSVATTASIASQAVGFGTTAQQGEESDEFDF
jgi:hypothetical protein